MGRFVIHQFIVISILVCICFGYPYFQNYIPNGKEVPHPCDTTDWWTGVGHVGPLGSGDRNDFGKDFEKAGNKWTKDLCKADSDGDGMSNGEELGDPLCQWSRTNKTNLLRAKSNPGVCDPWNSTFCSSKNGSLDCSTKEAECTAMFHKDTKRLNLMLPLTRIPLKERTFACMRYNLPVDGDFHIIATKPIYNYRQTVNFIAVFGCDTNFPVEPTSEPYKCTPMPMAPCQDLIAGYVPMCLDEHAGIRIGSKGYTQVLVQWYLNNVEKKNNVYDNSGVALYYTSKKRPHNMGIGTLIATGFTIPPNQTAYNVISTCPGTCTAETMTSDIHVSMTIDHMHLFGSRQKIEHIRNGQVLSVLSHDNNYDPRNPGVFWNKDPIIVKPSDSFKMTCVYNSSLNPREIGWGFDYSSEMCLGRIFYYPQESWKKAACASFRSIPLCGLTSANGVLGCNVKYFLMMLRMSPMAAHLKSVCPPKSKNCNKECLNTIAQIRRHPCLQGDFYRLWQYPKYMENLYLYNLYKIFNFCQKDYEKHGAFLTNAHAH